MTKSPVEESKTAKQTASKRGERFLTNVFWSWLGVAVNIFAGLLLSPYIIRKLGAEGYGLWALLFSTVGYYTLLDLGFRSAAVRYSAYFWGKEESDKLNEVINTALVYFLGVSLILLAVTLYLFRSVYRFFQISPTYQHDFSLLILMVGTTWSFSLIFSLFGGCLEGVQRFDVSNRVWMVILALRSVGSAVLLFLGYGLLAVGVMAAISQLVGFALYFIGLQKVFPSLRFSPVFFKISVFKEMAGYGLHSFLANAGYMMLDYTAPLLVGHFLPVAYVGYYNLPVRLLQYTADAADRAGLVTTASAAELQAKGKSEALTRLAIFANRYCFALYMPLTILLLIYGREILQAWVGASFASYSAPLLPILLLGVAVAVAGQFNSSTILFGLAQHKWYAYGLLFEALGSTLAMTVVIPKFGIFGAACVASLFMLLIRGLYTPWLVCRSLSFRLVAYLSAIYGRPLLTALPVAAIALWCKMHGLSGRNLTELLAIAATLALLYLGIAFFTCMEPAHRALLLEWVAKRWNPRIRNRM